MSILHAASPLSSNGAAVALSAVPLFVESITIQAFDVDLNATQGFSYFGGQGVSDSSFGAYVIPGGSHTIVGTRDNLIPVHQIYFYHPGGVGKCTWFANGWQ
jgi:hypothetical protein